jgi:transglutaminase-like putative cysteine protease
MIERLDNRQFDLLTITVAATLAAHIGHLPSWLTLSLAILLPLRAWTRRRDTAKVGAWIRLPLTVLLVALVIANFGNLFGREPGSVLGCGLLALKLLEAERIRDARVALGFAAFVLMSALLFAQDLVFTVLICAVLVLLLATLIGLQPAPLAQQRPLRAQLRLALVLLGASLPLAIATFVLVPRLISPLWGAPGADTAARSGLSDRMAPGSMTDLLIDDSPAFRVDFDATVPPPRQRYFRAIVLWDFDGTTWTRGRSGGRGQLEDVQRAGDAALVGYTITLEPTDRRWLPTLDLPLTAPAAAHLSADRVLVANEPVAQPRQYHVQSATNFMLAPTLSSAARTSALALPAGFDPKTRALAERWRADGKNDDAVIRAALDLFHASFTYTLSPPLLGRDSVDDFLFDTRRGFCEHYSSAFVFLMRAAGIPARVVTGYQGGWWSAKSAYLLVRQSDAHAWAEVWSEGRGWQRVDPTAAVSPARIELGAASANGNPSWAQSDWLRNLRNQFDFANRLWTESIVRFDASRQKSVLTPFGVADANPADLLYALSGVLGIVILIATLWAIRSAGTTRRGDALDRAWALLGKRLARAGMTPRANEGPLDLLQRARAAAPAFAAALEPLIARYIDLRYGVDEPAPERIAAFAAAARKLRLPSHVENLGGATIRNSAASRY